MKTVEFSIENAVVTLYKKMERGVEYELNDTTFLEILDDEVEIEDKLHEQLFYNAAFLAEVLNTLKDVDGMLTKVKVVVDDENFIKVVPLIIRT